MMKQREDRHPVHMSARLRDADQWHDVQIRNISTHGMMLLMQQPPPRGTYIDVRHDNATLVGRIMWVEPGRCGVRIRERISVAALAFVSDDQPGSCGTYAGKARCRQPDFASARSAMVGRATQFGAAIACVLLAAAFLAQTSYTLLARPSETIARTLR